MELQVEAPKERGCGCLFCALLPLELTCGVLRWVAPSKPKDLFGLAAVSPCFRSALKETHGLRIDLGNHHEPDPRLPLFLRSSQRMGELLRALATTFPRLASVTFTASLRDINDSNNAKEWQASWISPLLYGSLVTVTLRGYWRDQGWGNQKGALMFECEDQSGTGVRVHAVPGMAPHQGDYFESLVSRETWSCQPLIGGAWLGGHAGDGDGGLEGYRLKLKYFVGDGGGHSLHVRLLDVTIAVSPHEWNLRMEEWINSKLAREEGWAWCIKGRHPSLRLNLASDGTARFEEWRGPRAENEGISPSMHGHALAYQKESTSLLSSNPFVWSFHPVTGCVIMRSKSLNLDPLHLYFDQHYDEFYVNDASSGTLARGFPVDNQPLKSISHSNDLGPAVQTDLLHATTDDCMAKRIVLLGTVVCDPIEKYRRYSSVWDQSPPGQGHAQSMLSLPLAWCARQNHPGEWLEMQIAPLHTNRKILALVVQRRAWEYARQCVQKIRVEFQKTLEGNPHPIHLDYSPTLEIGFGKTFFSEPVQGRYFRINPIRWMNHISMRAGLLVLSSDAADTNCASPGTVVLLNPPEEQRTYSSCRQGQSTIDSPSAWSSGRVSHDQWMIIDAGCVVTAAGVQVQFRGDWPEAVTAWRVETKISERDEWQAVGSVFTEDPEEPRFLWFDTPVQANTIRVTVLEWEDHIALRCGVVLAPEIATS